MQERTVGLTAIISGVLWSSSVLLILAGTVVVVMGHRGAALVFFAHAMLTIGGACMTTGRCLIRSQTRTLINAWDLTSDARKVRRLG